MTASQAQVSSKAKSPYAIVGLHAPPKRYSYVITGQSAKSADVEVTFPPSKGRPVKVPITLVLVNRKWLIGVIGSGS